MKHSLLVILLLGATGSIRAQQRFDLTVRNDFFAGFAGNQEAFARGMKICEEIIAKGSDPNHAEALVWHGGGTFFESGQAFQAKDFAKGQQLWDKGLKEMDDAVKMAPENLGVRIPRGAVLLSASQNVPPQMAGALIERGITDFEFARKVQEANFDKLGTHPRGELLIGLASAYSRSNQNERARAMFELIRASLPSTPYATNAEKWLISGTLSARESGCLGCHVAK